MQNEGISKPLVVFFIFIAIMAFICVYISYYLKKNSNRQKIDNDYG